MEWLKKLLGDAYTEEKLKEAQAAIGKDFVSRADFNALNESKKGLDTQLIDRDKQLKDLQEKAKGNEDLTKQIGDLQAANKAAKDKADADLKALRISNAIDLAVTGAKGKNSKAVRALLDESKLVLAEDGSVTGLSDQLKTLKEKEKYLFDDTPAPVQPWSNINPPRNPGDPPPATLADAIRERMTPKE